MKTRNFILGFLSIFLMAWMVDAFWLNPLSGDTVWVVRKNAIYITGILSMALMSLAMFLSIRPAWLESKFDGLDKIYHTHKWSGIYAILFGLTHWLIKLSGGQLALYFDNTNKPPRDTVLFFMTNFRGIGKDLGEWSIYLLLGLLVMALIKVIPYKPWRLLHKVMPAIYLVLVFHTLALTPLNYWLGASGLLILSMLAIGTYSAIFGLAQKIGKSHKHTAEIKRIDLINNDILELSCKVDKNWPGHKAGQFAFLKFNHSECAHPFTIASAYNKDNRILNFKIKGLGDFTNDLINHLKAGQLIQVEGPYGQFNYTVEPKLDNKAIKDKQTTIWVAAGIGITPFLAWLEDMQAKPSNMLIDMHYCVRDASKDSLVAKVIGLCKNLPNINLYIHDQSKQQRLDAATIVNTANIYQANKSPDTPIKNNIDIWFCGPNGFANSLKQGFKLFKRTNINFHQEIFEMR